MPPQFIFEMCDVGKAYGDRVVLRNINLSFYYGAKIGVVGENGSGKSTLLRIMAGIDAEISGTAALAKGMRVRYVAQEPELQLEQTVRENLRTAMKPLQDLVDRFTEVSNRMADPAAADDLDKLMDEMGRLQERIDAVKRLGAGPDDGPRLRRAAAAARRRARGPALRRRAATGGAGRGAVGEARPAAAGRAHQPSRRRDHPVAGAGPAGVPGHGDHRHPRPLFPRQRHPLDPRAGRRAGAALRGQLFLLAGAEGRAFAGAGEEGDPAAADAQAGAGVDPQFAPGAAAKEPGADQGLRAIGRPARSMPRARPSSRSPLARGWATRFCRCGGLARAFPPTASRCSFWTIAPSICRGAGSWA